MKTITLLAVLLFAFLAAAETKIDPKMVTGPTVGTMAQHVEGWVNVKAYGAKGDGAANDTTAVTNALAASSHIYFPDGTYNVTSMGSVAGKTLRGQSKLGTTIKRTSTSDLISSFGSGSKLQDITLDCDGAVQVTGKGVVVPAASVQQTIDNARIINAPAAALEFAADGGSEFKSINATYYTLGAQGSVAAVKVNGNDSAAVPRHFTNTESMGCTLFDFGGASDFFVTNFYSNGLIYGANSSKVMIHGARLGDQGGTITIAGGDHTLRGIAAVALNVTATGSIIDCQAPSWNITDAGSGNSITMVSRAHTPAFTNSSAAIGNATVYSRWSREGRRVTVEYDITWGSSSSAGTGALEISVPVAANAATPIQVSGSFLAANAGSTVFAVSVPRLVNGATSFRLYGDGGPVTSSVPFTWAAGDILRGTITYTVP